MNKMIIPMEKEQISLPSEANLKEPLKSSLSPVGSNPDSLDGLPPISEPSDSPPLLTAIYTDVNIVPEHEKNELQQTVLNLEGEVAHLRMEMKQLDDKRRKALNKILDIKGSIRVFCRVRPFLPKESRRSREPILLESEKIVVKSGLAKKEFEFDMVFSQEASQEDVFVEVEPILHSALDGHNVCILAYGQTGTGKTFTMDGKTEQPGIVPRVLKELFRPISSRNSSMTFSMSMLEVYMGSLRDLLSPKPVSRTFEPVTRSNLNIQTGSKGQVEIEGLTEVLIPDFAKARYWYAKGRRVRSTSWTNVNETSSRSHCLTRISIYRHGDGSEAKKAEEVSKLWMVDLGGSERLLKTGATGLTLDEGRAINLSLSALGDVIAGLRRKRGHVPYRNSKLTQILKDSLGDGSKVLMLVHLSPCDEDIGETICSLSFAKRARGIESGREIPEDLKKQIEKRVVELVEQMREAEEQYQNVINQLQKAESLLTESKNLISTTYQNVEVREMTPITPREDLKNAIGTPRKSEKTTRKNALNSLPHFMTSTAASRQRQSDAERGILGSVKSFRYGNRSSVQFTSSHSQSTGHLDPIVRGMSRTLHRKSRYAETNNIVQTESPKSSGPCLKMDSLLRGKMVTSSDPNLAATLHRHRRRMSDFM